MNNLKRISEIPLILKNTSPRICAEVSIGYFDQSVRFRLMEGDTMVADWDFTEDNAHSLDRFYFELHRYLCRHAAAHVAVRHVFLLWANTHMAMLMARLEKMIAREDWRRVARIESAIVALENRASRRYALKYNIHSGFYVDYDPYSGTYSPNRSD